MIRFHPSTPMLAAKSNEKQHAKYSQRTGLSPGESEPGSPIGSQK